MKRKIIFLALLNFFVLSFSSAAYADTTIHLSIKTPASIFYNQDITVVPCNSDNNSTPTLKITPYCAILQSGIPSDWNWAWAPGAFLNSLNNIAGFTTKDKNNNDVYHYWSWSLNGTEGTTGLNQYDLQANDLVVLDFIDPPTPVLPTGSGPLLATITPTVSNDAVSAIISTSAIKPIFDVKKAVDFLIAQQKNDGSFDGGDMYTDWAGIAYGATEISNSSRDLLLSYFRSHNTLPLLLTDTERRSMALLALGQSPYSFNGVNYIENIVKSFDGAQFGDPSLVNDDVFALLVLNSSGYTANDDIITKDIKFIISKQQSNGSWENSVDMTSASVEALTSFSSFAGVSDSLSKASAYLASKQEDNGSWGSVYSTSWAMGAEKALGMSWTKNSQSGIDYLATNQTSDGAALPLSETLENRIWATSYAIPATLGKPWSAIFHAVPKPVQNEIVLNVNAPNNQVVEKNNKKNNTIARVKKEQKKVPEILVENTVKKDSKDSVLVASAVKSEITFSKSHIVGLVVVGSVILFYLLKTFFI